ncbi:hypothetical protein ACI797_05530 [Geodermatophilus sp. SYSU D00691]
MRRIPLLQAAALVGVVVALVDTIRDSDPDLGLLLGAVLVLQLGALLAGARGRSAVALRPDLTAWLHRQAGATGEPVERLADRCVAAYRAGLTAEPAAPR